MRINPKLNNKIHNEDCLKFLKKLPNNSIDLIVSSPPYNLGKEYEKRVALKKYLNSQKKVLTECSRVLKNTGSIFWQVGAYSENGILIPLDIPFFNILEDLNMQPRNRIIWARQHGLHARNKFSCRHETILWFTKSDKYKFFLDQIRVPQKYQNKKSYSGDNKGKLSSNPDGKNPGDLWVFRNVKHNHEEQTIHPCQFPEDLIARIILSTTKKNDIVFDPYMGTGTVAVVAKEFDRTYLGTEIEKKYLETAKLRINNKHDKKKEFANLKNLKEFVKKNKIKNYSDLKFQKQISKKPSLDSKIYSEEHHKNALYERLLFEENCFSSDIKNIPRPKDPLKHNHGLFKRKK